MDYTEVKERVNQLEGAIKRLDSVRKHLSRNASDIKTEIHASVSRNLECLRGREVSLLGAVDQVLAVKEDTLQGQQARLNQALGVLHTSLSMTGTTETDRQQITETLDRLNKVELSPEETPYISFRADHLGLREAILGYGRVDANGLPLVTAFEDPSKPSASLPRHFEEYEDVDHHVFYKTLNHSQAKQVPGTSINVTIPKLSNRVEDWLQKKTSPPGSDKSYRAARPSCLPQRVRSETTVAASTPGSSCSLNNWLSLIKQHADLEEEHDFEITDNTARLYGKSATPTSVNVWLAQAYSQLRKLSVSHGNQKSLDLFAHISKESSAWLQPSAHMKNGTISASPSVVKQRDSNSPASVNMRNKLFSHISTQREDWLHNESKACKSTDKSVAAAMSTHCAYDTRNWLVNEEEKNGSSQPRVSAVELEDVCRANELCCSMSECVSKPDCVTMFLCSEVVSKPTPTPTRSSRDKNNRSTATFDFQQWASTKLDDWLAPSPAPAQVAITTCKAPVEEKLEKLSIDMQMAEKMEAKEAEADSCDLFHMIPGLMDPVWQATTNQKGVKEEENLWLRKSPSLNHSDAPFEEWLSRAKSGSGEDSEGWSVVSDSFSVQSEQLAMDVATADHYINKWLL
ncbi:nuclear receptor coactivator 4 [Elysia marginata]|uniref:Nuclear receptor coactivator 4 n=1 Tax=Elysia marginata TaxID=1093978 RepID=A0AAV4JYM5_9GAST|nr:nuclear receptor coactivator 4 [Elysia marginata]